MLGTFRQDFRGGMRMLRKSPGFTFLALLSLAPGIGAKTAIFTIINAVFPHPLPVEEPSQLVELLTRDSKTVNISALFQLIETSFPNYEEFRDQNTVFSEHISSRMRSPVTGSIAETKKIELRFSLRKLADE